MANLIHPPMNTWTVTTITQNIKGFVSPPFSMCASLDLTALLAIQFSANVPEKAAEDDLNTWDAGSYRKCLAGAARSPFQPGLILTVRVTWEVMEDGRYFTFLLSLSTFALCMFV